MIPQSDIRIEEKSNNALDLKDVKQKQTETEENASSSIVKQINADLGTPQIAQPSSQNPLKTLEEEKKEQDEEEDNFSIFSEIFSKTDDEVEFSKMMKEFVLNPSSDEWSQKISQVSSLSSAVKLRNPKWIELNTFPKTQLENFDNKRKWKWSKEFTICNKRF